MSSKDQEMVIVDVSPTGEVVITTKGFNGNSCLTDPAVVELKEALGDVTNVAPTEEMKQKPLKHTPTQKSKNVTRRNN